MYLILVHRFSGFKNYSWIEIIVVQKYEKNKIKV